MQHLASLGSNSNGSAGAPELPIVRLGCMAFRGIYQQTFELPVEIKEKEKVLKRPRRSAS